MKKLFPDDEKGSKKGFKDFLDKKGFYVVLLLCIAVVAATALFVTSRNATSGPPDYEARNLTNQSSGNAAAVTQDNQLNAQQPEDTQVSALPKKQTDIGKPAAVTGKGNAAQSDKPAVTPAPDKKSAPKASTPKKAASVKQQSFIMPVAGNISVAFTKDTLVFSNTLRTWQAHKGLDIEADRGTPVKAVADGVISDVRNDAYYGITVVVDHGNGLQTLYRNLAADDIVAVNQKVKQGEVIGSIGNTATDESVDPSHLHFEVLKNNVKTDPMTYLPKNDTAKVD